MAKNYLSKTIKRKFIAYDHSSFGFKKIIGRWGL